MKIWMIVAMQSFAVSCIKSKTSSDSPQFQSAMVPKLACLPLDSSLSNFQFTLLVDSANPGIGAVSLVNTAGNPVQVGVWIVNISESDKAIDGIGNSAKGHVELNVAIGKSESTGEGVVDIPDYASSTHINCQRL